MASNYHNRFQAQQQQGSQHSPPLASPQSDEEEVIDPNLSGPFGERYEDNPALPDPLSHSHSRSRSGGWRQVETTEQLHDPEHQQIYHPNQSATSLHPAGPDRFVQDEPWHSARIDLSQSSVETLRRPSLSSPKDQQELKVETEGDSHVHGANQHGHHHKSDSLFDLVHRRGKRTGPHIKEHGEDVPINLRHLIKRPVIRQWLHGGKLYREKDERKPSQYELFFDLIFVAVVNGIGHATAESSSGINVLKFVLSFWPCFSIWTDVRKFLNTSGTDDVLERLILLGWMILLCGYCANVSGVEIVYATPEMLAAAAGRASGIEQTDEVAIGSVEHSKRALGAATALLKRAGGGPSSSEEEVLGAHLIGDYWFTESYHDAISSAIGFFLVAKLWRLCIYLYYGISLPKFRRALWLNALALAVIACIYIPVHFSKDPLVILICMCAGIVAELLQSYMVAAILMCFHGRKKHSGDHMFIPALSHEHSIERYVLFVILIVGESIISSNFVADEGHFGLNTEFGRAALGITISFLIIWLYYDADGCRVFQHALRRNAYTSITFGHLHFPLTASLILMAASLASLVRAEKEARNGVVWYFGGSLACVMFCIGVIGLLHRNLDVHGSNLVPRWMRLSLRFAAAAAMAVIPVAQDSWDALFLMGIYVVILACVVAFETIGKIGAVGRKYDPVRAAELHNASQGYPLDAFGSRLPTGDSQIAITHADKKRYKLDRRASWHPFDDLTSAEKGEEDVGIESEIGHLEEKPLATGQRWAYAA